MPKAFQGRKRRFLPREAGLIGTFMPQAQSCFSTAPSNSSAKERLLDVKLEYKDIGEVGIFRLFGEAKSPLIMKQVKEELLIALSSKSKFVFDFGQLTFISSTAIDQLMKCHKIIKASDAEMHIRCPDGIVRDLLRQLGMTGILRVSSKMDELLRELC